MSKNVPTFEAIITAKGRLKMVLFPNLSECLKTSLLLMGSKNGTFSELKRMSKNVLTFEGIITAKGRLKMVLFPSLSECMKTTPMEVLDH